MASHGSLAYDRRVQLEAMTLAQAGHRVTLYCTETGGALPSSLTDLVDVVPLGSADGSAGRLHNPYRAPGARPARSPIVSRFVRAASVGVWLLRYRASLASWGRMAVAHGQDSDVWHLHDFPALMAIAPRLARGTAFVYDSHEIFLEAGSAARLPGLVRHWLRGREGRLVRHAQALVTVNRACADVLASYRPRRIVVVYNCPPLWQPDEPVAERLRAAADVPPGSPLILYHGTFGQHRGIEELVDSLALPGLERAHLVFLGYGDLRDSIPTFATTRGVEARVHVLDPVPPDELLEWTWSADVEALPIQDSTLNHFLSTPNKLFEAIAVGVPVVVSDFPAMRSIVLDDPAGPLGAVCDPTNPRSIAEALSSILDLEAEARGALRDRCRLAARERWNWEHEGSVLVSLYDDLRRRLRS